MTTSMVTADRTTDTAVQLMPLHPSGPEGDGKGSKERRHRSSSDDLVTLSPSRPDSVNPPHGLRPSQAVTPAEKKALLDDDKPRHGFSVYG